MEFSTAVLAKTLICAGLTLGASVLTFVLYRGERPHFGLLLSAAGAITCGPMLATVFGVWTTIKGFQQMAMLGGGGIVLTAASLWDSAHPLRFSFYGALIAGFFATAAALLRRREAPSTRVPWSRVAAITLVLVLLMMIAVGSFIGYMRTARLVVRVIDPGEFLGQLSPAYYSSLIARRLTQTAVTGLIGMALALALIPLGLVMGRPVPLAGVLQKFAAAVMVLLTLYCAVGAIVTTTWVSRLEHIALTGSTR